MARIKQRAYALAVVLIIHALFRTRKKDKQ
jgi:hypothetical protein